MPPTENCLTTGPAGAGAPDGAKLVETTGSFLPGEVPAGADAGADLEGAAALGE